MISTILKVSAASERGATGRALQSAVETPTPNDDRLLWLWRLLEPQVRQRIESRIERRVRESRFRVVARELFRDGVRARARWSRRPRVSAR